MIKALALLTPVYVTFFWCLVFLFHKRTKNKAKTTLGIFMLMAFLLYCAHAIFFSKLYLLYSYIESIYIFALLVMYPLFYQYIHQLANKVLEKKLQLIWYLPAILLSIVSLILTILLSPEERVLYLDEVLIEKNLKHLNVSFLVDLKGLILLLSRIIFIGQAIIFLVLGIKLANAHNTRLTNYFSDTNGRKMNWIRNISAVFLVVSVAGIVFALIGRSYFAKNEIFLLLPSLLFGTVFFRIGFKGNLQLAISEELIEDEHLNFKEIETNESLKKRLIDLFENKNIYRFSDLRITTISLSLNTNRTYISRLINDEFSMNFNEFVNKYRIEEAKQLLCCKTHNSYTMDHIAEKSGFGSVASFSRAFKEFEGITPGKFRLNNVKK